ncbi:hypothetical protein E2562_025507 [Oryza meyeriana var. granulata]|uniref:Uncharacterized protein n=1 Tax=Oryza meyeriana var. granulata TaxID=110450 RepID=A0A6G1C8U1_9ORYZ|nr:hypothetical protein E2562_025507 [Oryza meyeriana var. granulata]
MLRPSFGPARPPHLLADRWDQGLPVRRFPYLRPATAVAMVPLVVRLLLLRFPFPYACPNRADPVAALPHTLPWDPSWACALLLPLFPSFRRHAVRLSPRATRPRARLLRP